MDPNNFKPDKNINPDDGEDAFPNVLKADTFMSRRNFVGKAVKLMALGALSHFTLLGGVAHAATPGPDECPGGLPGDDVCQPRRNPDKCPGELPPADSCPENGRQPEDECDTGGSGADICDPTKSKSDQCESGTKADDKCPSDGRPGEDKCPTGQSPEDYCPPKGGIADGDVCLGGGATTNGEVQDTCKPVDSGPKGGDQCGGGTFGAEDDCKEAPETPSDLCAPLYAPFDDDTCYNGTNVPRGANGGDDWCDPEGKTGSDQCNDGTPQQDLCTKTGFDKTGLYDTCPGGGRDVDTCEPGVSDDYCLGGFENNDECKPPGDEDECPGGGSDVDECPTGEPPEDECTAAGGCSGGDQEGTNPVVDNCMPPEDACIIPDPDIPNPE